MIRPQLFNSAFAQFSRKEAPQIRAANFSTRSLVQSLINQKRMKTEERRLKLKRVLARQPPQKRGVVLRVNIVSPKKPNSAKRRVAVVKLKKTGEEVRAYIPGEGGRLDVHNEVLLQGGKRKDLPGIKHLVMRGKLNMNAVDHRRSSRSKYGTKKPKN